MSKPIKKTPLKPANQSKVVLQAVQEPGNFPLIRKLALALGLIAMIIYANTLSNGYALDDYTVIKDNTIVVKGISAIPEILSTPYHYGYIPSSNDLYRPLALVMFAIEYSLSGGPALSHFINVILYACCILLLFLFLDQFFERKKIAVAFIASLLFALHPLHTEVVANIKSRDELLCFFFAFLSLNVFFKYLQTGKMQQLLLGSACFFLSLLSKETVITFIAIIPLIFFFYRNENKKYSRNITVSVMLVSLIYLAVRYSVLSAYGSNTTSDIDFMDNSLAGAPSFNARIATAVLILGYYIKLLLVPFPLICDYSYNSIPFTSFSDPMVLISLAFYIFLAVLGIRLFRKNHRDPYAFCIFFFLITISLFSNILFLIGTTMGERLVFFPSLGFCLAIALLIEKWVGNRMEKDGGFLKNPKIFGIIIPVSIIYGIITIGRNSEWKDNYTLYSADVKKAANDGRLNYYLGSELEKNVVPKEKDTAKQKKLQDMAIAYLNKAIAIFPDNKSAQSDLGASYFSRAQYDSAEIHMKYVLELDPSNMAALNNLATVYLFTKKYRQSIDLYRKAIASNPNSEKLVTWYYNIGCNYLNAGQFDSAAYYLQKTIAMNPAYPGANMQLGVSYFQAKRYDLAGQCFSKILASNPNDGNAARNLALSYKGMNNIYLAKKYEAIAQRSYPGFKL